MPEKISAVYYDGQLAPPFKILSITEYSPGCTGEIHLHDCYQAIAVVSGNFIFENAGGEKLAGSAGTILIIPPQIPHFYKIPGAGVCRTIQFNHEQMLIDYNREYFLFNEFFRSGWRQAGIRPEELGRMEKILKNECLAPKAGSGLLISGMLMEILVMAVRSILKKDEKTIIKNSNFAVNRAAAYIENHFREPLMLGDLSAASGLSPARFSVLFRKEMKVPPMRYIQNLKLEKAFQLLKYTGMSITEISRYLGFESIHYFSRSFKKHYKRPPSDIKNQLLNQ